MGAPPLIPSEYDFVAARRRLEAKPKSAGEKLTDLEDAVSRVSDGAHVAIGGILFSRTPMALIREVLRARRRGLTLIRNLSCYEADVEHFDEYARGVDARGADGVAAYLERYVYAPPTFADYLDLFGGERLARQRQRARELTQ